MKKKLLNISILLFLGAILLCTGASSCKKILEVEPPIDVINGELVFEDKSTAISAMSSVYGNMGHPLSKFGGINGLGICVAMKADELTPLYSYLPDYLNNTTAGWTFWNSAYREYILQINSVIEGLAKSKSLDANTKRILDGEAKFSRAFMYFYLVNFYGDVPLVLSTDYKINSNIARSSVSAVYEQIISDLQQAEQQLETGYLDKNLKVGPDRTRPNKKAASAMMARVFLYMGRWSEAEAASSRVIGDEQYELLADLNSVFLKNSRETIWQIQPVGINLADQTSGDYESANTADGRFLINPFYLDPFMQVSNSLLESFEPQDQRRREWITTVQPSGYVVPFKYKQGWGSTISTEYAMTLRLSEQYLIRAEARAHLNNLNGDNSASSDLNTIRLRAGLQDSQANDQDELLEAIALERRHELFLEWGHRWLDLKRTGKLNEVMTEESKKRGVAWQPYKALMPIPYEEFKYNPAIRGHQNPGYTEQP